MCTYNSCPPPATPVECEAYQLTRFAELLSKRDRDMPVEVFRQQVLDFVAARTGGPHDNPMPELVLAGDRDV